MIRILEQSTGNVVGVQISEKLTGADYESVFVPALEQVMKEHDTVRTLCYFDDTFSGFEAAALFDDAKFGIKHAKSFEKIGIVGGPEWVKSGIGMFKHFIPGEVKLFAGDQLDEAWGWIR